MKILYGYKTSDNCNAVISEERNPQKAIAEIMKDIEHTSYEISWPTLKDGSVHIDVWYKVNGLNYSCNTTIEENALLEIDGLLYELPLWAFNKSEVKMI